MPEYSEIIWTINATLLAWILNQYFKLRKEINLINLSLVKNYATNESIKELIENQHKMLDAMLEIKIDQATIFERIKRYHDAETKNTIQTEPDWTRTSSEGSSRFTKAHK